MSEYSTFEDSTFITEEAAEDMETEITKDHPVVIGKNATVQSMVKVGDEVLVGDELITFEKSFEEETLNKLLGNIGEEIKEEVVTRGRNKVKSHYSGVVEAIEIYSGSDLEDLSPSLQKIVGDYWRGIKKKEKLLDKYSKDKNPVYKCGVLVNQACGKIESRDGKIKGQIVNDGVLIIFYIKYKDIVTIGDKITFFTALKGTIGDVIPRGYEPYTLDKPDEKIGLAVAPAAVLARMTPSILITMLGYKVLIGLKEKLKEIYER